MVHCGIPLAVAATAALLNPLCELEHGFDYIGNDVASVRDLRAEQCCDACQAHAASGCTAWTWTSYQNGTCWLKHGVDVIAPKRDAVSARLVDAPIGSDSCYLYQDVDFEGHDMSNIRASEPHACCAICRSTLGCRAYSWSTYQNGTCWLKSTLSERVVVKPGVVSALAFPSGAPRGMPLVAMEQGVDYVGNDIGHALAQRADDCGAMCLEVNASQSNVTCSAYSWSAYQGGMCWLKHGKTKTVTNTSITSGRIVRALAPRPKATVNNISTFNWCGRKRKWIALTFDDVFNQPQLDHLLRDLRAFNLTATFFVVTMDSPGICNDIKHILTDGHTIENHSNTHAHFTQINATTRFDEIKRVEAVLYNRCGIAPHTMTQFRPPYLEFSRALADEINALGYTISAANVDSFDWKGTDLNSTWKTVQRGFDRVPTNGSAVVLHHHWTYKPNGTEGIIARYAEHFGALGYRFVSARECFAACLADNDCVMPGTTAFNKF